MIFTKQTVIRKKLLWCKASRIWLQIKYWVKEFLRSMRTMAILQKLFPYNPNSWGFQLFRAISRPMMDLLTWNFSHRITPLHTTIAEIVIKKSLARNFHVPSHTKKFTFFVVSWPRIDTLPQNLIHKVTSPLHTIAEIAISEKKLAHDRISLSWFAS